MGEESSCGLFLSLLVFLLAELCFQCVFFVLFMSHVFWPEDIRGKIKEKIHVCRVIACTLAKAKRLREAVLKRSVYETHVDTSYMFHAPAKDSRGVL